MPWQKAITSRGAVDPSNDSRSLGQPEPTAVSRSRAEHHSDAPELVVRSSTSSHSDGKVQGQAAKQEASGKAVVSHEQLLAYLQHKGGARARVSNVPFEGMNKVVYRL